MESLCWVLLVQALCLAAVRGEKANGNEQILKSEIESAINECVDTADTGTEEFDKRTNRERRSVGGERKKRNLNIMMEQIHDYLREHSLEDSGSGEWDYGGGGAKKNTWEAGGEDKSSADNAYQHEKKGGSGGSESKSVQEQNASKGHQNMENLENNFDSRGARLRPFAGVRGGDKEGGDKEGGGNKTDSERGIRRRRDASLVSAATQNEVDDKGIPKESLFMKLIQETITSQQMKLLVEQQLKNCFHQLAGESQDDGCSFSNALERCLGLEVRKRRSARRDNAGTTTPQGND